MTLHSHLLLMTIFAAFAGLVGGVLLDDAPRKQLRAGAAIFAGLIGGAFVLGWILRILPL